MAGDEVLAPLGGLGGALTTIGDLVTGITGLTLPLPVFAETIAGANDTYWYLPLALECELDVNDSGANDIAIRVDPILEGTAIVGITIVARRLTELQMTLVVGLRSDSGFVTDSGPGNWVRTELSHEARPLPDRTTITLRGTGELADPGDTQDTRVTITFEGGSVGADLDHAVLFGARGGNGVSGVSTEARRPDAIAGLPLGVVLPATQDIFVPPKEELAGVDTQIAGAAGALTGTGPHLSLHQESTLMEILDGDQVLDSTLTIESTQRLHLDADAVDPDEPTSYMELRRLARTVTVHQQPQLTGSGTSRALDGTFVTVTASEATDIATLRLSTEDAGVAATIRGLNDMSLRLRGEAPLLIELHGANGPEDTLTQPLEAVVAQGGQLGVHPVGTLGQPLEPAPQAVMLDIEDRVFSASVGQVRRARVRERVAGIHARDDSPDGAQDWLVDFDFGDQPRDRPDRPLRVRLRAEDSTTLARAVHLPESISLDLHVDPPGDSRDLGVRATGAIEGLRVLTDAPPAEGREARSRVHAGVPAVPAGGAEFELVAKLPKASMAEVATAIVAAHGLGVPAEEGALALDSLDVLAQVPPVPLPADSTPDTPSVSITARTESGGLTIAAASPTGVRAALSDSEQRRAVRPTPQVALGFGAAPETLTEPLSPTMQKVTARVVGLSRVEVGGEAGGASPVPLPGVQLVLDAARVNRSARLHTFDGDRADLRARIGDVPDEMAVDLRTAEPVGIGGTTNAPMRRPLRMELSASSRSGEIMVWGEPAQRAWYGPNAGRLAGIGLITARVPSLPDRLVFAQLHDPAMLDSEDDTRPELWDEIGDEWVRDGMHIAAADEIVACRAAIVSWDRDHPSDDKAKWSYTYIHGLKISAAANPPADDADVADLPALTVWTPFQTPTDDDTFEESKSALSMRVGPRDGDDDDRPLVDVWLGKLEHDATTDFVDWRDLMPATSFATKGEIILSAFGGQFAIAEEFGTFDPTREGPGGPGKWWVRAVGKLPVLGFDVTLGSDGIQAFADRPDFDDPCED